MKRLNTAHDTYQGEDVIVIYIHERDVMTRVQLNKKEAEKLIFDLEVFLRETDNVETGE